MSIFGNTTTTPQAGGLFGAANNQQQQQQPAGGLFGAPAQNATQQGSSLFGSTAQQTPAPSLFGATNTTNTNAGGAFGGGTNQGTSGGGLFGAQQQQQQPQATGGSLFGGASNQQPAGGGLFGNTTQTNPSGGAFGSATQQQPTNTGGLFGSTTQQPQQQQGGGLFGSSAQPAANTGGGLFGSTTQQSQQQQQGGLFGGKPSLFSINTNTGGTGTSTSTNPNPLFGSNSNQQQPQQQQQQAVFPGGIFSQPSQGQQQRPSMFGNPGQSTSTNNNSLFGGGNTSTLNTSALGTSTLGGGLGQQGGGLSASTLSTNGLMSTRGPSGPQQQVDAQAQHARLLQRIEGIYLAWNATSSQCRFKHTFYNLVNPNQVNLYRQPPNVSNELWEKATRENPDPKCLVPVVATGFDDLRERVNAQTQQAEQHKKNLNDLKTRLDALAERHSLSNTSRLQRAASQQTQLTQRLLAFIQHLHLLIPALRSSSIRPEEEQLRGQLEEIEDEIRRGRFKGKLNELWALIGAVNAATERGRTGGAAGEWAVVDEEGLGQIAQILSEQQNGLAHLTKILQGNLKDLSVIMGGKSGAANGGEEQNSYGDDISTWGSTSTLRASALR